MATNPEPKYELPFQDNWRVGKEAESEIARWLVSRGCIVLPACDIFTADGFGPRLFGAKRDHVAPDLLIFDKRGEVTWIEVKRKSVFSWHRKSRPPCWTTGIDLGKWMCYVQLQEIVACAIWLFFLHQESIPDKRDLDRESPKECPAGLFGETIQLLSRQVHHTSDRQGPTGMIYWSIDALRKLATLDQIKSSNEHGMDRKTLSPKE